MVHRGIWRPSLACGGVATNRMGMQMATTAYQMMWAAPNVCPAVKATRGVLWRIGRQIPVQEIPLVLLLPMMKTTRDGETLVFAHVQRPVGTTKQQCSICAPSFHWKLSIVESAPKGAQPQAMLALRGASSIYGDCALRQGGR